MVDYAQLTPQQFNNYKQLNIFRLLKVEALNE
jgi:hypothetical protein